jgi:hypothetical protein
MHQTRVDVVRQIPREIDAGTAATFTVRVSCSAGCSLADAPIMLVDRDGVEVGVRREANLESGDVDLAVTVPISIDEIVWTATCARHERDTGLHEKSEPTEVRFRTLAHKTSMAVWDVQSPVAAGRLFSAKIGVRCTASCALTGEVVRVLDEHGTCVGRGPLGPVPWPGTDALYWAEVELTAPSALAADGLTVRRAALTTDAIAVPHEPVDASFTFMATRPPDHCVTVSIVDRATGVGLADVEVWVGRYALMTDPAGTARAEVPSGAYEISMRRDGFSAEPIQVEVGEDVAVRVEAAQVPTMAERAATLTSFEGYPWG